MVDILTYGQWIEQQAANAYFEVIRQYRRRWLRWTFSATWRELARVDAAGARGAARTWAKSREGRATFERERANG